MIPSIGDAEARREMRSGLILAGFFVAAIWSAILLAGPLTKEGVLAGVFTLIAGFVIYRFVTRKSRHRYRHLMRAFPEDWEQILDENVGFYHSLEENQQKRFKAMVQVFLDEVRITGIQTKVDDKLRLLIASSAIIPIFGFRDFDYFNLGEILVFPDRVQNHGLENVVLPSGRITGQVQGWQNHQVMKLSKPDLLRGFSDMKDRHNVGIHEFAHVIDDADGEVDGIPRKWMPDELVRPWTELMYKEMEKIRRGSSRLRAYGATNEAEFFAVATEYFFERPRDLQKDHPELYSMLQEVFQQDTQKSFMGINFDRILHPYGRRVGRNEPCPCGSGKKYKHCCGA